MSNEEATEAKKPELAPGNVDLFGSFPPLCATMDKTEVEVAAAYLVRALAANGNTWRPIAWKEIGEIIKTDMATADKAGKDCPPLPKLISDLAKNPFARPDFHIMVDRGFARWLGAPGTSELELTDAGRERLRKYAHASVENNGGGK